ncbi:hypothetical protein LXA43DRAFT_1063516 [Ganoderma leucocontextum]|nr:hypothetical protein LXA43DRAFT_1063516 [Ganoderma leucocontextum]
MGGIWCTTFLAGAFQGKLLVIMEWGRVAKLRHKVANNNLQGGYQAKPGQPRGLSALSCMWHQIGHPHNNPTVAADMVRNATIFEAACSCIANLNWRKERSWSSVLWENLYHDLSYDCREIVYNMYSQFHWDEQDPHWAWAIIIYLGTFEDAYLEFPQLNLRALWAQAGMECGSSKAHGFESLRDDPAMYKLELRELVALAESARDAVCLVSSQDPQLKRSTHNFIRHQQRFNVSTPAHKRPSNNVMNGRNVHKPSKSFGTGLTR